MKVGIHGKKFSQELSALIGSIIDDLRARPCDLYFSVDFKESLAEHGISIEDAHTYEPGDDLGSLDYLITLGGDGTLLEAVTHIDRQEIPILGINTGRMGFLATIAKEDAGTALDELFEKKYDFDDRNLLLLESSDKVLAPYNYALNDFTILKKDTSSMITVNVYIEGEYLNSYWADGIIVATPTGSTGYSLSCGGPLIMPGSQNFVITPVSPHTLTARPMIVPDDKELTFEIVGRGENFLVSLDSRFHPIDSEVQLKIRKADFIVRLIKLHSASYFKTIRQKLSWGVDVRN